MDFIIPFSRMPTERAGYNVSVFAIDVSPSMADTVAVGDDGVKRSKLDLAKEYVARRCESRVRLCAVHTSAA